MSWPRQGPNVGRVTREFHQLIPGGKISLLLPACGLVLSGLLLSACQMFGQGPPDYPASSARKDQRRTAATSAKPATEPELKLDTFAKLARVPQGSFGPRLHKVGMGWVAVWAAPGGDKPGWYSVHVSRSGEISEPLWLAEVTPGLRQFTLGTVEGGGLGVVAVRGGGKKEVLEVIKLGPEGALLSAPRLVVDSPASILWAEVVPTAQGSLVVWAERDAQVADIYAAVWTSAGIEKAHRVVRDAYSWQLVSREGSVALASLEDEEARRVIVRQLGAQGQTIGAPIVLANHVDGGLDLDMAMTGEHIVVAWSQQDRFERRIHRAVLDASGNVVKSEARLSVPRGDQALVHMTASPTKDEVVIVWEEPLVSQENGRILLVSSFAPGEDDVKPQARLQSTGSDTLLPLVVPTSNGMLAVLSEGSSCSEQASCTSRDLDYLGFLTKLEQNGGFAVALKQGTESSKLSMAWDLSCVESECFALVADQASPPQVFLAPIAQGGQVKSPWSAESSGSGPRMTTREALVEVPELVAMSGRLSEDGSSALLNWLSYFDPNQPYTASGELAPDGRSAPVRARLENQVIPRGASTVASSQVISYRARSLGGVRLASQSENQGLMVWAALDGDAPQLFATLVDGRGARIRQKMLTKSTGEITDVNAVSVDSGYIVAWVESLGHRAEVWAMTVNDQLVAGPPHQVSAGASTPLGLSLSRLGAYVSAVWGDSRGGAKGQADLFSALLDASSAAPIERESQLMESDLHSHSPRFIPGSDASRATLVWIESDAAADAAGQASGTLYFADYSRENGLGEAVAVTEVPSTLSFSAECSLGQCRALVATQDRKAELWGVTWRGKAVQVHQLLSLRSASASAATPLLLGDSGFYADQDESGTKWLLTRVGIDWDQDE